MPSPFPRRPTVRRAVLAIAASALLSAPAIPGAPSATVADAAPVATAVASHPAATPRARTTATPAARGAMIRRARAQQARQRRRARAARRQAATLERRSRRAHLPEVVRSGALPAARAPLGGLAAALPGLAGVLTPVVDAIGGVLPPTTAPPAGPAPAPTPVPDADPAPVAIPAVGVLLHDTPAYTATLSRATVPVGQVRLQLQNAGEDPHDLKVQRVDDGSTAVSFAATDPGATRTRTVTLGAGSYRLLCTFTAPVVHADAGMRATLVVSG